MKKYLVEFIGTFFLVLTVVLTVGGTAGVFAPIAIGSILMVMVFAGGHISGGHYNPAVTLGVWMRGKMETSDIPGYLIAQLIAGVAAAFIGRYLITFIDGAAGINLGPTIQFVPGFMAELLGTFALVYVFLQTATAKGTEENSFYGLAIGFTFMACAYGLGGVSGGAFNPAIAIGISTVELTPWSNIGMFLAGQTVAGAMAAIIFKFVNGDD